MKGWYSTDLDSLDVLDPADWERGCRPASLGAILAEHVWEHLEPEEALAAARHCHTYLARGAYLRLAVPDGLHPDPDYIERVRPGGTGPGAGDHRVLYSYRSLAALLRRAGFRVEPLEFFDEQGRFHERPWSPGDGLVRRSRRHDPRNADGRPRYTSLIVDAWKDDDREAGPAAGEGPRT